MSIYAQSFSQCQAFLSDGSRCPNTAAPGGRFCPQHWNWSPSSLASASTMGSRTRLVPLPNEIYVPLTR
jgi:hypothetical protein